MLCGCVCINGVLPIQSLCTNHISFKHSTLAPSKSIGYLGHIISIWSRLHKHFTQTQFSLLHYSILDSLICQSVRQGTVNFWNSCPEFSRLDIKHPQTSEICAVTHAFCYILAPNIKYRAFLLTPDIKEDWITWSTSNLITGTTGIISMVCSTNVWLPKYCAIYLPSMTFPTCTNESPFHREILGIAVCMADHTDCCSLDWCWWPWRFKGNDRCIWREM